MSDSKHTLGAPWTIVYQINLFEGLSIFSYLSSCKLELLWITLNLNLVIMPMKKNLFTESTRTWFYSILTLVQTLTCSLTKPSHDIKFLPSLSSMFMLSCSSHLLCIIPMWLKKHVYPPVVGHFQELYVAVNSLEMIIIHLF